MGRVHDMERGFHEWFGNLHSDWYFMDYGNGDFALYDEYGKLVCHLNTTLGWHDQLMMFIGYVTAEDEMMHDD